MSLTVKQATNLIFALRQLTAETGTATTRTQNKILRSLTDEDLLRVAVELQQRQQVHAIWAGVSEVADGNAR